jgi:hypothetical protein
MNHYRCAGALGIAACGFLSACSAAPEPPSGSTLEPTDTLEPECVAAACPAPTTANVPGGDAYQAEFAAILNASGVLYSLANRCAGKSWLVSTVADTQVTTQAYSSPIYVAQGTPLTVVCGLFGPVFAPTVGCVPSECDNSNIHYDPNCPGGCGF